MKKLFAIFIVLICSFFVPALAENIPVRITPIQILSTNHDEIEVGDWINFEVVSDVYKDDKLYIAKGTKIVGIVDFVHNNGWADPAEFKIIKFMTHDVNNTKILINYPININQACILKQTTMQHILYIGSVVTRGQEIYIEPDTKVFNIFISQ